MTRTVLHLVRGDVTPAAVADRDWVVYLHGQARLTVGGTPHAAPVALGELDHDQLVQLVFAADLVVTW